MKRSALPLPRYVRRKPLKGRLGYFFDLPTWARKAGCPMRNEPLGTDYAAAVQRAETILLPAFDAWRTGGHRTPQIAMRAAWHARLAVRRISRRSSLHQARRCAPSATTRAASGWSAATS